MRTHPHETTVCALFKSPIQAQQALHALETFHLNKNDVSLITSEEAYEKEQLVELIAGDKLHEESIHAAKVGGLAGAIIGGLTALGSVITGGASLLVTGPMIVFIAGAGGLLGSFLSAGFSENEAQAIDNAIQAGQVAILVHAENKEIARNAEEVLKAQGADKVHHHQ